MEKINPFINNDLPKDRGITLKEVFVELKKKKYPTKEKITPIIFIDNINRDFQKKYEELLKDD